MSANCTCVLSLVLDDDGTVLCFPAVRAIMECQECSSVVIVLFTCQYAVYKYMTVCMINSNSCMFN